MKLIILAAGKGTRLMPLTRNTPKSLLALKDGRSLLETQIDGVAESGVIDEVVLVIGYRAEQIEAKMKIYEHAKVRVSTIYNPFFEISNNLLSLWLALSAMDGDFMVTNGDNIFSPETFRGLAENTGDGIHLTVTDIEEFNEDDMKVIMKDGKVARVSKDIKGGEESGESVGLAKISGESFINVYRDCLNALVRNPENINRFWLETFNYLSQRAVQAVPYRIERKDWFEFDIHLDLNTALDLMQTESGDLFKP